MLQKLIVPGELYRDAKGSVYLVLDTEVEMVRYMCVLTTTEALDHVGEVRLERLKNFPAVNVDVSVEGYYSAGKVCNLLGITPKENPRGLLF